MPEVVVSSKGQIVLPKDESGADEVEGYLVRATEEEDFRCYLISYDSS